MDPVLNDGSDLNFHLMLYALLSTITERFSLIEPLTAYFGPFKLVLICVRNSESRVLDEITSSTSITYFRRLFQSLKTVFILCGCTITLTVESCFQARALLRYGNENEQFKPFGVCMNCGVNNADVVLRPCHNPICLTCAYKIIESVHLNCGCGAKVTSFDLYGVDIFERNIVVQENNFVHIINMLSQIVTNNYLPSTLSTIFGNFLIRITCKNQHNYNLRPRTQRYFLMFH